MPGGAHFAKAQHGSVWALTPERGHAAVARADAAVDVFDMAAGGRVVERFPSSPTAKGRPVALSICQKRSRSSFAVATGSLSGDISIGDKTVAVLDGGEVAGLVFADTFLLAAGGSDKEIIKIHSETGKEVRRYSLAREHRSMLSSLSVASNGKSMAACSQSITVLDVETGKHLRSFSGHSSPVTASSFFANDSLLITGTQEDSFLQVWEVTSNINSAEPSSATKKKRRRKSLNIHPMYTLIAPEPGARTISVHGKEGTFSIAVVLKSGAIAIWSKWKPDQKHKSSKSDGILYPSAQGGVEVAPPVHAVAFSGEGVLQVLYGNSLKPEFHSMDVEKIGATQFLPTPSSSNLLISKNGPLRAGQVPGVENDVVSGALAEEKAPEAINASATEAVRARKIDTASPKKREKKKANGATTSENGNSDKEDISSEDGNDAKKKGDELTLHERLRAIGVGNDAKTTPVKSVNILKTSLDSRAEVILQALNAKDARLLNTVLYQGNSLHIVKTTIRQLPAATATNAFLNVLVSKLRSEPRRAIDLVPWIQNILSEHAGALISQPKSSALFNLKDTVAQRNQTLDALNRLEGRLQLVVAQAQRAASSKKTNLHAAKPQVEYIERVRKNNEGNAEVTFNEGNGEDEDDEDSTVSSDEEGNEETAESSESSESSGSSDEAEEMELTTANGDGNPIRAKHDTNGHKPAADDMDGVLGSD